MKIIENSFAGIKEAAEILTGNGIVAFPTETVYGLGANAFSKKAVTTLYEIKRRPTFNPLIIHVSSYDMAREYGFFNYTAKKLVKKYWPGPLTIIVKKKKSKVYCFVGEMTSETGIMHESFKYAVNKKLPIHFIVEDNSKSVCTDTRNVWSMKKLSFEKKNSKYLTYYKYHLKYPHAGAGKRVQF